MVVYKSLREDHQAHSLPIHSRPVTLDTIVVATPVASIAT